MKTSIKKSPRKRSAAIRQKRRMETWCIATLLPHPRHAEVFAATSENDLQHLADCLERNGLTDDIEITEDGTIICGHRRVRAAERLGYETIDCWVRDDLTTQESVEQHMIEDNLTRPLLTKMTAARCYRRLRQLLQTDTNKGHRIKVVRDSLSKRFAVPGQTLDLWVQLLNAPHPIQQLIEDNYLPLSLASKLVTLSIDQQWAIAEQIPCHDDAEQFVRQSLAKRMGRRPRNASAGLICLMRSLERDIAALKGQDIRCKLQANPGAVSILRRSQRLIGRLVAAIDGRNSATAKRGKPRPRRQQGAH